MDDTAIHWCEENEISVKEKKTFAQSCLVGFRNPFVSPDLDSPKYWDHTLVLEVKTEASNPADFQPWSLTGIQSSASSAAPGEGNLDELIEQNESARRRLEAARQAKIDMQALAKDETSERAGRYEDYEHRGTSSYIFRFETAEPGEFGDYDPQDDQFQSGNVILGRHTTKSQEAILKTWEYFRSWFDSKYQEEKNKPDGGHPYAYVLNCAGCHRSSARSTELLHVLDPQASNDCNPCFRCLSAWFCSASCKHFHREVHLFSCRKHPGYSTYAEELKANAVLIHQPEPAVQEHDEDEEIITYGGPEATLG